MFVFLRDKGDLIEDITIVTKNLEDEIFTFYLRLTVNRNDFCAGVGIKD